MFKYHEKIILRKCLSICLSKRASYSFFPHEFKLFQGNAKYNCTCKYWLGVGGLPSYFPTSFISYNISGIFQDFSTVKTFLWIYTDINLCYFNNNIKKVGQHVKCQCCIIENNLIQDEQIDNCFWCCFVNIGGCFERSEEEKYSRQIFRWTLWKMFLLHHRSRL